MWKLTVFLSIIWALSLLYGEWLAFFMPSLFTCSWPHLQSKSSSLRNGVNYSSNYVKIAVITDPQLMDRTSLRLGPKSLALEMAQFYTDLYMRRAFSSSIIPFNPDFILFLGDYFDGGPILSDEEWQESLRRFRHIFYLNLLQQAASIKVYYLTGNHDIGYAAFNSRMPEVIKRHEKEFGERNFRVKLGGVDFIAVDAQTVDGNPQGDLASITWNFVRNVSKDTGSVPRVLLTHIPLYRGDWTSCGPHRSSPIINQRISRATHVDEIVYQNYITENSTKDLLDLIKPVLVLSGHDHDQCTVSHVSNHGEVVEHTVGTVSWQQGNLHPTFMLLSVSNSTSWDASTAKDVASAHLCFLPVQLYIYLWYLFLFATTLLMILLWPESELFILRVMASIRNLIDLSSFSNSIKEKNEDDSYEYEEVWDAEGTMHLIKKPSSGPTKTRPSDRNSTERGSAVMRAAARKQNALETDASIPPDVNIHVGFEDVGKVPSKTNKSRTRRIIWKLLRTLRALIIIAAFNVPLYVFMLFKDWIDK